MHLAITGFGPFGDHEENVTAVLAKEAEEPPDHSLAKKVLGVSFRGLEKRYLRWLDRENPDAILHLGLAADSGVIRLERMASRFGDDRERKGPPIQLAGPAGLETAVDLHRLASKLRRRGLPATQSLHAGNYLCNYLYYLSLRWLEEQGRPGQALFVHLPYSTEEIVKLSVRSDRCYASLPYEMLEQAVRMSLAEVASLAEAAQDS